VIAEGVETEEQAEMLRQQGCDKMQGYLYGRPMPPADLDSWLRAESTGNEDPSDCRIGGSPTLMR
jgi:EAL domain-containing protein (putative c-di-GMP-specific phosphodiesterase class I)